jgi:phosphoglucosamine mutase
MTQREIYRFDGDHVMAICAQELMIQRKLKKKTLVSTVMSNMGLEVAVEKMGGKMIRTAVGDRYVVECMRKNGYSFGGEQSGHLIFLDHITTGDGILAGLQLLAIMKKCKRPISELVRAGYSHGELSAGFKECANLNEN